MPYISLESIRMVDAADVVDREAPALLILDQDQGRMLVADGHLVFLDGKYRMHTIESPRRGDWLGALIENVSIEVDTDAISFTGQRNGVIVHTGAGLFLHAVSQRGGSFANRTPILLAAAPEAPAGTRLVLPQWRLVASVRDETVTLYESEPES